MVRMFEKRQEKEREEGLMVESLREHQEYLMKIIEEKNNALMEHTSNLFNL